MHALMMPPLPNMTGAQKKKVADPFEKRHDTHYEDANQ